MQLKNIFLPCALFVTSLFAMVRQPANERSYHRLAIIAAHFLHEQQKPAIDLNPVYGQAPDVIFRLLTAREQYQQECKQHTSQHTSLEVRQHKENLLRGYTSLHTGARKQKTKHTQSTTQEQTKKPGVYLEKHPTQQKYEYGEHLVAFSEDHAQTLQLREQAQKAVRNGDTTVHTQGYTFDAKTQQALKSLHINFQDFESHSGNKASHALHRELITLAPYIASVQSMVGQDTQSFSFAKIAKSSFILANECKSANAIDKGFGLIDIGRHALRVIQGFGKAFSSASDTLNRTMDKFLYNPFEFTDDVIKATPQFLGDLFITIAQWCPPDTDHPEVMTAWVNERLADGTGANIKQWKAKFATLSNEERTEEIARLFAQEIVIPLATSKIIGTALAGATTAGRLVGATAESQALGILSKIKNTQQLVATVAKAEGISARAVWKTLKTFNTDGLFFELVEYAPPALAATEARLLATVAQLPKEQQLIGKSLIDTAKNIGTASVTNSCYDPEKCFRISTYVDKPSIDVWDMNPRGSTINGRKYTRHALERMAPNTPAVTAELITRALKDGLVPGTDDYTKAIVSRNIPPSVVEHTITMITPVPGKNSGTLDYIDSGLKITTNLDGDVVTIHKYTRK